MNIFGKNKQEGDIRGIEEVDDPFRRRSVIIRSPPQNMSVTAVDNQRDTSEENMKLPRDCATASANIEEDKRHVSQLKQAEECTFIELGNKLSAANVIVTNAKNIHKTLRDNLNCAIALYQRLRECREAIVANPIAVNYSERQQQSKATQVDPMSPVQERKRKVPKTPATITALQTQEDINNSETPVAPNEWKRVNHRKEKKKKNKQLNKRRELKEQGEAITIKTNTTESYAEVIKEMKNKINPTDIGVDIQCIRRTRAGELLVKLNKGEGQAEKLKIAIGNTLGDEVLIKTVTKNQVIDIRDMDESTDKNDLVNALMEATQIEEPTMFKVLNFRASYGRTNQALVQAPIHISTKLLNAGKVRVGWIMCRVRIKTRSKQCFRCLEQGHIASQCKSVDRSNLCRRCCKPGHKSKECNAEIRCILCHEAGSTNAFHYIGSAACANNRKNMAGK